MSEIVVTNVASHISTIPHTITVPGGVSNIGVVAMTHELSPPFLGFSSDEDAVDVNLDPLADDESSMTTLDKPPSRKRGRPASEKKIGAPKKGPFICGECDRVFDRTGPYTDHIRYVHQHLAYKCECGKEVATLNAIRRHLKNYSHFTFDSVSISTDQFLPNLG